MKVKAIVEMPRGSKYKYEKDGKGLKLDRVLNQRVPFNYGYFPDTLFDDGDPLDVFILSEDPIPSLTSVEVEIYGLIRCKDQGLQDDKILAFLVGDDEGIAWPHVSRNKIESYLTTYKPGFVVEGVGTKEEAISAYEQSLKNYTK